MKRRGARPAVPSLKVQHLAKGSALSLADADTVLLVVRGACAVRGLERSERSERVEAGTVLVPHGADRRLLDRKVARALGLLQAEPAKRWTVERLARAVGLSRAAFARRFAALSGRSPLRYLTELRLALAASLLETTDDSLAELALRVGYTSEFAFSRAFKRQHGVAPGSFRRLRRSAQPFSPMLAAA
ncbi:MAG: AraC family transcriptional regulator [Polyangiaceae bacterium]